jgi:hypothetical protein
LIVPSLALKAKTHRGPVEVLTYIVSPTTIGVASSRRVCADKPNLLACAASPCPGGPRRGAAMKHSLCSLFGPDDIEALWAYVVAGEKP